MATGFQTGLLLLVMATASTIGDDGTRSLRSGVIFGGAFEGFEVVAPLAGAKATRMAAHYEWDYGVRPFTKKTWEERGLEWDGFLAESRKLADRLVEKAKPKIVRDHRGTALYAILADEDPFLTSIVLSSKFWESLRETLGDRIHVVLLERNRIYLFPATGGALADFAPSLVEEYGRAPYPVSLEILLLDRGGLRVVGELERKGFGPDSYPAEEKNPNDTPAKP